MAYKKDNKKEVNEKVDLKKVEDELKDYIDVQIKKNFNEEVEKVNKKLIREKNKKILFKNIVIVVLLFVICSLLYIMYCDNFFNRYFGSDYEVEVTNKVEKKEESLDNDLIDKYSYLLDNIVISEESKYIDDFYKGNLSNELKNYLTLNTFNFDELDIESDCNLISNDTFKERFEKMFDDKYESASFEYNGVNVRYIDSLNSYITDKKLGKSDSKIKREIKDIEKEDDKIKIITIEKNVKDDKSYGITYTFKDEKLIDLKVDNE